MPTERAAWDLAFITQADIEANTTPEPDDPTEPGGYVFFEEHLAGPFPERFDAEVDAVARYGFRS